MNKKFIFGMIFWCLIGCSGLKDQLQADALKNESHLIGGGCKYKITDGTCVITDIVAGEQARFSYESDSDGAKIKGEGCSIAAYSGDFVSEEFIKKHGLREGNSYKCLLYCATAGTCTPHMFEFEGLENNEKNTVYGGGSDGDGCRFSDVCGK